MAQTFFFYDLETSGLNPRQDRIMQFAGQRTDLDLQPIGDPVNLLVAMTDDVLPSPHSSLVTGITPQQTVQDGYSEAAFAQRLYSDIFTPDTIAVGYNNVRFDDEFVRHLLWRNFHDPYEWTWRDGRSRWDLLDVVRMMRALRPEGISWPVDEAGRPTNRLELITKANQISHHNAHDALADVTALIAVARLIKQTQPQLFAYLLSMRHKKAVQALVNLNQPRPFVYSSGRYDQEHAKTTLALAIAPAAHDNVLVYDLRYDPAPFVGLDRDALVARLFASWQERQAEDFVPVPVKLLQYNRCPAVAPAGVLEQAGGWDKLHLDLATVQRHQATLQAHPEFIEAVQAAFSEGRPKPPAATDPAARLYEDFLSDRDRVRVETVRQADQGQLVGLQPQFDDPRLPELLLHYKARQFPASLTEAEQHRWQTWRAQHLRVQLSAFTRDWQQLAAQATDQQRFVLEELQLWAESILPLPDEGDHGGNESVML